MYVTAKKFFFDCRYMCTKCWNNLQNKVSNFISFIYQVALFFSLSISITCKTIFLSLTTWNYNFYCLFLKCSMKTTVYQNRISQNARILECIKDGHTMFRIWNKNFNQGYCCPVWPFEYDHFDQKQTLIAIIKDLIAITRHLIATIR